MARPGHISDAAQAGLDGRAEVFEGGAMGAAENCAPPSIYQAGAEDADDFGKIFSENLAEGAGKTELPSSEVLGAFCNEWGMVSPRIRFDQKWVDRETAEIIDFAQIADEDELKAASDRAERQYEAEIARNRREYVRVASAKYGPTGPDGRSWEQEFTRNLAMKDLYFLVKHVLGRDKLVFHLHYFMAETVREERLASNYGMRYKGLREFPRESYKSTVMGLGKCVQWILIDPNVKILYLSAAAGNAEKKLDEARKYFRKGTALAKLFPEHSWERRSEEGNAGRWTTPARTTADPEGTIEAAGATTSLASRHYDKIIPDDMWDEKSVTSKEVSASVNQKIQGVDYLLADQKDGVILFVGTRFAHDDPTLGLLEDAMVDAVIAGGVMRCGRSLFPENLPLIWMYQACQTQRYVFTCQIILWPKSEDRGLDPGLVQFTKWSDLVRQQEAGEVSVRLWVLTDAGGSDKKDADPASIGVVAVTSDHRFCLVHLVRKRMDPAEFIDECERIWDEWEPHRIVRQNTLLETTIMSFIRRRNADRQAQGKGRMIFHDYSLKKREKKSRITASLQPVLGSKLLHIDPTLPRETQRLFKQEMREHPLSSNDDMLDMFSEIDDPLIHRWPDAPRPAPQKATGLVVPTRTSIEDEQREQKRVNLAEWMENRQRQESGNVLAGMA